jgi:hypothetical protein
MPKVAKDKATTAASKAAARRKTRGASCMGAEPVLNQDVPQVVVRASGAATASSGTISLWRNQTLAEKLRATIDRDCKWDDYHVNVRECGDPPMTLTTRLSEAYLRISAGQRLSAKLIRDLQVLYAPQGVTVQYPIRDKTQPFPLALKEALDCFQDDDLRMRAKTPLQLQLTLMQNTNQKQVALICEVMSKTQATSSPDQASCLCEFAKTIKRLEIDKTFPEEIDRFRPLLVRGYVAHWGFEKRKKGHCSSLPTTTRLAWIALYPLRSSANWWAQARTHTSTRPIWQRSSRLQILAARCLATCRLVRWRFSSRR